MVITDRGLPIARLLGLNATATLDRLVAMGSSTAQGTKAAGQARPRPRRPVANLVADQRR